MTHEEQRTWLIRQLLGEDPRYKNYQIPEGEQEQKNARDQDFLQNVQQGIFGKIPFGLLVQTIFFFDMESTVIAFHDFLNSLQAYEYPEGHQDNQIGISSRHGFDPPVYSRKQKRRRWHRLSGSETLPSMIC